LGGLTEHIGLGEGSENGDLVTEDLAWWPGDTGRCAVDTIDDELTTTTDVVDGILEDLWGSGGFNDDVETVWVLLLKLLELSFWVLS
jgi:hypothetical protein